ncbi:MAG: GmrSD restriction endonuclease domain-containing protein [Flavobacteriales bacterium]
MNINLQSSKAQDRTLNVWFQKLQNGEIKLPRFQRHQAWDKRRITSLLETITYNLPLGITLLLEVDEEKFISRYLETAPQTGVKVNEHLLDGQQRLTSLWRSMHNNYENETFFIYIPEFDHEDDGINNENMMTYCQGRWFNKNKKYPLWADSPSACFKKGLIPMNLLKPTDIRSEIDNWINDAVANLEPKDNQDSEFINKYKKFNEAKTKLDKTITQLREIINHYNLPFLALPSNTPKDIALRVFINMNTNTKPLSLYDVIVAEIESVKGVSLHDLQNSLNEKHPKIAGYFKLEQLILATSALLQDKVPNNSGMLEMSKELMVENWNYLEDGLNKMTDFLANEGVYSRQILPTNAVLAVVAALYKYIPESLDDRGKAEILLKKYIWSAFFTDRYENSAASRAFKDFVNLKNIILKSSKEDGSFYREDDVPALNRDLHAISDIDFLSKTGWPKGENIRARAIMCVASKLGSYDFSDGHKLTQDNLENRDYHHIFPKAILNELDINPNLALNCAIITSSTNKSLGAKAPLNYIKERYNIFDEETINVRLQSHLIPTRRLTEIEEYKDSDGNYLTKQYEMFIKERAALIKEAAEQLCAGKQITTASILSQNTEISLERRELDEEVSKIELATRKLIVDRLPGIHHNGITYINNKIVESATNKYESFLRKNPGELKEDPVSLRMILNYLTLSEYKDIIIGKSNWSFFQDVFETHGNVLNRYTQLGTMRDKLRHDNVLTKVERLDGEASIDWFNKCLIEYIN